MNMLIVFFLFLNLHIQCEVYKLDGFIFDFDSGWHSTKGSDPNSSLRLEKNSYYAEFIKLEDELSDFYIKTRLEEQRQQMEAKAVKTSFVKTTNIHTKSKAYYFTYQDKKESVIALFTYEGFTYSLISFGIDEDSFKKLIFTFRKDGETIEIPKPPPKPKKIVSKQKNIEDTNLQYISIAEKIISSSSLILSTITESTSNVVSLSTETVRIEDVIPSTPIIEEKKSLDMKEQVIRKSSSDKLMEYLKSNMQNNKMLVGRKPLNPYFVISIVLLYIILSFYFKFRFSKYSNLKIKPYPKELPPDFLFPFIITRINFSNETVYQIITRTGQSLSASILHPWRSLFSLSMIMLLVFHALWSISSIFNEKLVEMIFLSLPFGGYVLSFIEVPFIIGYIWTFYQRKKTELKLVVKDSQMAELATVVPTNEGFTVKDAKGRDVIKVKRVGFWKRRYIFINEDNQQFMEVRDEYPEIWIWVKLLGNYFIKKRCYYSIRNEKNDMVGFLYIDPSNFNHYQIHFDYDYMRLVNSVQLVSSIIYIISTDTEEHILYV